MSLKRALQIWFVLVLLVMLALTVWASLESNVIEGYKIVGGTRWGLATLGDAYFGFMIFYFWVAYLHPSPLSRLLWLGAVLLFGNFAIAGYCLWRVSQWDERRGAAWLLLRKAAGRR